MKQSKSHGLDNNKSQVATGSFKQKAAVFLIANSLYITQLFFLLTFLNKYLRLLALAYIAWILIDKRWKNGGSNFLWLKRSYIWDLFASYFPVTLIKEKDLPSSKPYIFCYHPHGIISLGAISAFGTEGANFSNVFPNLKNRLSTFPSNFYLPVHREISLGLGFISCSRESLEKTLLENKESVTIVVGGAKEVVYTNIDQPTLFLKKRKGFVKLALQTGADLVPVYCFGENSIYKQTVYEENTIIRRIQNLIMEYTGYFLPVFSGVGLFSQKGNIPSNKALNVVVGAPVKIDKTPNPSSEQIDKIHEMYVRSLVDLFERNKSIYGGDTEKEKSLEIV